MGCLVAVIIVVLNSAAVLECGQRAPRVQRAVALATILSSLPSATLDSTMTDADRF